MSHLPLSYQPRQEDLARQFFYNPYHHPQHAAPVQQVPNTQPPAGIVQGAPSQVAASRATKESRPLTQANSNYAAVIQGNVATEKDDYIRIKRVDWEQLVHLVNTTAAGLIAAQKDVKTLMKAGSKRHIENNDDVQVLAPDATTIAPVEAQRP